jgi:hypothetical protein
MQEEFYWLPIWRKKERNHCLRSGIHSSSIGLSLTGAEPNATSWRDKVVAGLIIDYPNYLSIPKAYLLLTYPTTCGISSR